MAELKDPKNKVLCIRGQFLLGQFQGVVMSEEERDELSASLKMRQEMESAEDVDAWRSLTDAMHGKFDRGTNRSHQTSQASTDPAVNTLEVDALMTPEEQNVGGNTVVEQSIARKLEESRKRKRDEEDEMMAEAEEIEDLKISEKREGGQDQREA